jgi:hypothetical protein
VPWESFDPYCWKCIAVDCLVTNSSSSSYLGRISSRLACAWLSQTATNL